MPEPTGDARALLRVEQLQAFYGDSQVLHGLTFEVHPGQVATLLGRNGAGKSSALKAIMGILRRRGSIRFVDDELIGLRPFEIGRLGLAYCPEERGIFASLNVRENLLLPPVLHPGGLPLGELYALFPHLRERSRTQGTRLSGGEQQMLAIARILRTGARLLLLDEPTEGLAPTIIEQIGEVIAILKNRGLTILLVEQNFSFAAKLADHHYVVENGRIVDSMRSDEFDGAAPRLRRYLGV